MDRLDEIEARANAATPGPWTINDDEGRAGPISSVGPFASCDGCSIVEDDNGENDADFVAHAREDVPWLIARVRALEEELADSRYC